MKIKATMSYHLTPIPVLIIRMQKLPALGKNVKEREPVIGWYLGWPMDSRMEISEEIKNRLRYGPTILFWFVAKGKENRISETSKHITYVESTETKLRESDARVVVTRPGGKREMLVKGYKLPVIREMF